MDDDRIIRHTKVHSFISTLYTAVHGVSPKRFQEKVLERLKRLIHFDKALWLSGYAREILITQVYLYNLPDSLMASWEERKGQDRVLKGILEDFPGRTVDMREFYTQDERLSAEIYQNHSKKFGIEHVITTALPDYHTGLVEAVSLYRSDRDNPFSREDREMKEFLFPLMAEAFCYNQLNHMLRLSGQRQASLLAVCDQKAWLRHAEPGFHEMLKEVWPDWSGPVLPEPFLELIASSRSKELRYKPVHFRHEKIGEMSLVFAHRRKLTRQLSKREDQVALMFASGKSYKEIAAELELSPATVRNHIGSIYAKLNVSTKLELAAKIETD